MTFRYDIRASVTQIDSQNSQDESPGGVEPQFPLIASPSATGGPPAPRETPSVVAGLCVNDLAIPPSLLI